jgi:hypothetical protein
MEKSDMALVVTRDASDSGRRQINRLAERGELRPLYSGIYTNDLDTPIEVIVRRELYALCALLASGALLSHRSALESGTLSTYYLTGSYPRTIDLGPVQLKIFKGPPPLPTDLKIPTPCGDTFKSSEARAFLENYQRTRSTGGERRTLDAAELENLLEKRLTAVGEKGINQLRDQARECASQLDLHKEYELLDKSIGALLGTREHTLTGKLATAFAARTPVDDARLALFERLKQQLIETPVPVEPVAPNADRRLIAFIESYFSNFIEGTEFALEEAQEIVLEGRPMQYREDDSHDIIGTSDAILESLRGSVFPKSYGDFETQLRRWNTQILYARVGKNPGEFKKEANRAGTTYFVMPDRVVGTLMKGYEEIMAVPPGTARAAMAMFVVAEVHPFTDGNGRTARLAMNLALTEAGLTRIIIPTVFRDDYLSSLRALSLNGDASPYTRMLSRAAAFSRWLNLSDRDVCFSDLKRSNALAKVGVLRF